MGYNDISNLVSSTFFCMHWNLYTKLGLSFVVLALVVGGWWYYSGDEDQLAGVAITEATASDIKQVLSETGSVEAKRDAVLSFGASGQVESIQATSGASVEAGAVIASLNTDAVQANLRQAEANLSQQQARLQELRASSPEEREQANQANIQSASTSLAAAQRNLRQVRSRQNDLVRSARDNLYTSNLQAYLSQGSTIVGDDFTAPTVTGTYNGTTSGSYRISMFQSQADSGWSFRSEGLGDGIRGSVSTVEPQFIGRGLFLTFPENFASSRSIEWTIPVPNDRAQGYTDLKNALENAKQNRESALEEARSRVEEAQAALAQARSKANLADAESTVNKIASQQAAVDAAQARVQEVQARINDHTITAPFAGVITDVTPSVGERVSAGTQIAGIVSEGSYEVDVKIPEVDTGQLDTTDTAEVTFDALPKTQQQGSVISIAPTAETVEGVKTIEVTLALQDANPNIRPGLSADVDITTAEKADVVTIPERSVFVEAGEEFVYVPDADGSFRRKSIETGLEGSNGNVEILSGLSAGGEIVGYLTQEQRDIIESNLSGQ